jgi:hypothetical protein
VVGKLKRMGNVGVRLFEALTAFDKGKAIPPRVYIGPEGSRSLMLPEFSDSRHTKGASL